MGVWHPSGWDYLQLAAARNACREDLGIGASSRPIKGVLLRAMTVASADAVGRGAEMQN